MVEHRSLIEKIYKDIYNGKKPTTTTYRQVHVSDTDVYLRHANGAGSARQKRESECSAFAGGVKLLHSAPRVFCSSNKNLSQSILALI